MGRGEIIYLSYTVTTRMTSALRWAAMRAILMFHNCEGQSHKTVSTDHNFWRERRAEADSNRGPSAYQPNALPLGQTGSLEDVPLVEFIYLVFTCMPGESYWRRLRSLLCLGDVFQVLINSLVCWFCTGTLSLILFHIVTFFVTLQQHLINTPLNEIYTKR